MDKVASDGEDPAWSPGTAGSSELEGNCQLCRWWRFAPEGPRPVSGISVLKERENRIRGDEGDLASGLSQDKVASRVNMFR